MNSEIKTDSGKPEDIYEERGCGYRVVEGAYLVGSGGSRSCDALPLELLPCPACEFEVKFSRGMQAIHIGYLKGRMRGHICEDEFPCPVCSANIIGEKHFFLMFVSQSAYTPKSFIDEAYRLGVSKRFAPGTLPKEFRIGEDWILLAMKKYPIQAPIADPLKSEPHLALAIFYAFKPERMEIVLYEGEDPKIVENWKKNGFVPVFVPRGDPRFQKKVKA